MPILSANGKRILFIQIPKTGGTSLTHWMQQFGELRFHRSFGSPKSKVSPRHLHGEYLEHIYEESMFDGIFMVIRDPMARVVSEYRYQTRKRPFPPRTMLPFGLWLTHSLRIASRNPWYRDNHFRPQVEFEALGTKTFKLEDGLNTVTDQIQKVLDIPSKNIVPIQRLNPMPSKRRKVEPSLRDQNLVRKFYRSDFDRFEY